jgi:hypothetical protein
MAIYIKNFICDVSSYLNLIYFFNKYIIFKLRPDYAPKYKRAHLSLHSQKMKRTKTSVVCQKPNTSATLVTT